jgi:hypothetical protein
MIRQRGVLPPEGSVPMRTRLAAFLSCCVLAAAAAPADAQVLVADRPADAAAIRAHIESIFQAFVDKDRQKLADTHGSEWRGFTPYSGHVIKGREAYMNEATFEPGLPKNQGMVGYRIGEFDIVFYGDTAVVSFVADVDRMYGTDKSTERLTFVDVYHKDPGGWMQVASNTSLHPDSIERRLSASRTLSDGERSSLMQVRDGVWRAWFAGDREALGKVLVPELITIGQDGSLGTRQSNLDASAGFAASGGKLLRLEFPSTEIQAYGNTAIMYSSYVLELQAQGGTQTERGMATEVFVRRDGTWVHTGWQLSPAAK